MKDIVKFKIYLYLKNIEKCTIQQTNTIDGLLYCRKWRLVKLDHEFNLEEEVKKYGFESLEELNSFRFMDHSIGLFIQQAKKEGYCNG
jgi:hypothetical protein